MTSRRRQPPENTVRCPWCGAAPGTRCTTPRGRPLTIPSHPARREAHTAAEARAG